MRFAPISEWSDSSLQAGLKSYTHYLDNGIPVGTPEDLQKAIADIEAEIAKRREAVIVDWFNNHN